MSNNNRSDGRKNNTPPKKHMWRKGQSGNPKGRPKKRKPTFSDEIRDVFGKTRKIVIDGKTESRTMRSLILEQIARGAAQGNSKMTSLSIPFLKIMDDTPDFEILPEDKKALDNFIKNYVSDES